MCTVSMLGDHYIERWSNPVPPVVLPNPSYTVMMPPVSRQEFDELQREVLNMKELLKRAKKYDEDNGEPDCEMTDKIEILRQVADMVGVSLEEVFGT